MRATMLHRAVLLLLLCSLSSLARAGQNPWANNIQNALNQCNSIPNYAPCSVSYWGSNPYYAVVKDRNGSNYSNVYSWSADCPSGQTYQPSTDSCKVQCPGGYQEDPYNPGTCMDRYKCQALNDQSGFDPFAERTIAHPLGADVTNSCPAIGCAFVRHTSGGRVCSGDQCITMGQWHYSGDSCNPSGTPPPPEGLGPPNPPKPSCIPIGGGITACTRPGEGKICATASTGRELCWTPGETGVKYDGPTAQQRTGPNGPTSPPSPPPGDSWQPPQGPGNTSHTTPSGTVINTLYYNYTTTGGTNAGNTNQGRPATNPTGGGGGGGDDGDGDGDENGSASGGEDCSTPLVVQGGDPVLAAVARQAWLARCGPNKADANGNGQPDWTEVTDPQSHYDDGLGDGTGEPTAEDVVTERDVITVDAFDRSGFGWGNTCPALPTVTVFDATIELDREGIFCDWMHLGGWFVLLVAGFACLRIVWSA